MRHQRVREAVDGRFQDELVVGVAKLWPPLEIDFDRQQAGCQVFERFIELVRRAPMDGDLLWARQNRFILFEQCVCRNQV